MTAGRRALFEGALAEGRKARRVGRPDEAFAHFERAHVIGQAWIAPHLLAHWEMLRVGWLRIDVREVAGQARRLLAKADGDRLVEGA